METIMCNGNSLLSRQRASDLFCILTLVEGKCQVNDHNFRFFYLNMDLRKRKFFPYLLWSSRYKITTIN